MGKRSFDDQKYGLAIQWYSRAIEHLRSLPGIRPARKRSDRRRRRCCPNCAALPRLLAACRRDRYAPT